MVFCSTTFGAGVNATHFPLSGEKKHHIQPERYMQFALELSEKCIKIRIDKNI
jgi:hypothetical protein